MDCLADSYRLDQPTPLTAVFSTTGAAFLYQNQVITTKVGQKIRELLHSKPLRLYIQQKETWTDKVFDPVDWPAFERCMNNLSVHKRINVTKYVFNWQNTGRQKQLFELGRAAREDREPQDVGQCRMGCGKPANTRTPSIISNAPSSEMRGQLTKALGCYRNGWRKLILIQKLKWFSWSASATGHCTTPRKRYGNWPTGCFESNWRKPYLTKTRLDGEMLSKAESALCGATFRWSTTVPSTRTQTCPNTYLLHGGPVNSSDNYFIWVWMLGNIATITYMIENIRQSECKSSRRQWRKWLSGTRIRTNSQQTTNITLHECS